MHHHPFILSFALGCFQAMASPGPDNAPLEALRTGNARFVAGTPQHPNSAPERVLSTGTQG
jgi:hypothetical protein